MRKITLLISTLLISLAVFSQTNHWIESFENPLDTWSGYTTGTINFQESGAWDFVSVFPESSSASWDGSKACRINDDEAGASITSPSVNTLGKVSFYYHRPFSGTGTFQLQVSLDGGAFNTLDNVVFDEVTSPTYYEYEVNDVSDNIKVKILNDDNSAHLTIDYVTLTNYTPGANIPPSITSVVQTPSDNITSSTTVSVSSVVTDGDGTVSLVELHWGTSTGSLANTISMTNGGSGDTYTTITDIPVQTIGTTVFYEVYAEDDDTDGTTTTEYSYAVLFPAVATLPYLQEFDPDLGNMYTYNVLGDQVWEVAGFGNPAPCSKMSGFDGGSLDNEDWMITPSFDLSSGADVIVFSFDEAINYEGSVLDNQKIMISTDYSGIGDPTTSTWEELIMPARSPGNSWSWVPTGDLDITSYAGNSNVHIAFKYLSQSDPGNSGTWEIDNVSVSAFSLIDWANLQWPGSGTITVGTSFTVYAQAYEPGVTDASGQGAGITTWIGYSTEDTDPSTWTDWVPATYFGDAGNNDEYTLDLGMEILTPGTYYYASRFQLETGPYQYGGFSGGFWDGVNNVSGVLTVNPPSAQIDWANLQWPPDGTITIGDDFVVYAQVYEPGVTDSPGQGAGISAWIGYSTEDTDPATWTNWVVATFNVDAGINDEYMANIGSEATASGTIYYASRFKLDLADYVYGGFNGGFWDGTTNVSGVLTVNTPNVMINEVDADTPGSDTEEFIELYDGGVGNTDLSGLVVVLYNGSDDKSYTPAIDLDGYTTNAEGYFVIGSTGMGTDIEMDPGGSGWLQNGADGVALHIGNEADYPNDTPVSDVNLIDAIVYDTYDGDDSGLLDVLTPGQPQINEGGRGDKDLHSNQRIPNGEGGMRMTMTYDQSPPTITAENIGLFVDWTGAVDSDWFNAGNWSGGAVPTTQDVTILALDANMPTISGGTATCAGITVEAGAALTLATDGSLTATGASTLEGDLYIMSDGTGVSGSFIDNGTITGAGMLYFDRDIVSSAPNGAEQGWHLISSPLATAYTNYDMYDYWVNTWDESIPSFINHIGSDPCVPAAEIAAGPMTGWSVKQDLAYQCEATNPGTGNVLDFDGVVTDMNTGAQSIPAGFTGNGYNLVGNPYPSGIDASLIVFPAELDGSVNTWNAGTHQYDEWTSAVGSYVIAPTQGFWVLATAPTTFDLAGAERAHGGMFYKESIDNVLQLSVIGNGNYDETFVRFMEGTSANYDLHLDAQKLFSTGMPSLYTTSGGQQLAIDAQSATDQVPMAFQSETPGAYVIEAFETSDFTDVYLQDLQSGMVTDLLAESHEFNHTDGIQNFIIHFAPVGINEINSNTVKIWSFDNTIMVNVPADVTGEVVVYNMMGQEVARTDISSVETQVTVSDVSTNYVVKVISNSNTVTGKVFVK